MSSKDPLLLLRLNVIISDITDRVNTGAAEILEIVSKYEEELRLAKEEIHRQRQQLDAVVPQQHTTLTSDAQCSELQHSLHLSVCEQKIPPEQLLRDEEASQSNNSDFSVYSVALTNIQFEELTKSHQTDKEDDPYSCHEGEEFGRPLEAHDDVSQIDLVQIKAEEEPMSIHMGEECCQSTLDAAEDDTMPSNSSQSFKIERKTLSVCLRRIQCMENCSGDGRPSSPDQQMEEKPLEPLIQPDGCQLPSPRQLVAQSQESRGDQGRKQSCLDPRRRSKRKLAVCRAVQTCASNADFQMHLKIENQYNCYVCGKECNGDRSFKHHILTHDRGTCPICQKNMARVNLRRHMLIHTGEKRCRCNFCGKAFSRRDHLKGHMASHIHDKPHDTPHNKPHDTPHKKPHNKPHDTPHNKPHMCPTCGKQFGQKRVLERHKKIHTREISHHCPISRKGFNHSSNLNAHMAKRARVKKVKKPKFCPICQKDIYSCFSRHMLVHSGEKPYSCEFCGKRYRRNEHLRKHTCLTGTIS